MKQRKRKKYRYRPQKIIVKTGGTGAKLFILIALFGAAYYYRDKLGIKLPWVNGGANRATGEPSSNLAVLQAEARQIKSMMADSLAAGDNSTYVSLQNKLGIVNLQIENERDL